MGFLSKSRTLENTEEEQKDVKKKGSFLDAFLGTGKYAKTDEERQEQKESRTLSVRLGDLGIKKYKDGRLPKYNDKSSKRRFEVGSDFDMRTLPNLIYSTAQRNGIFRSHIGGRFSREDRDDLQDIMRRKSYLVGKIKRQLDNRNEKQCKIRLSMLFK